MTGLPITMLLLRSSRPIARAIGQPLCCARTVSTLPNNKHIYVHTDPVTSNHTLTLTPTTPPVKSLALGTASSVPPTPNTFRENLTFHGILQSVIAAHAVHDPDVHAQAAAYASQAGTSLGSGGLFFPANHPSQQYNNNKSNRSGSDKRRRPSSGPGSVGSTKGTAAETGAGGASAQGGAGGAGRGGWVHVSDQRNPPDYGRIAWPEDIFGSLEVDGRGAFVGSNGNYQESGTYRMCTNDGILKLSPYLRERLVERVQELEDQERRKGDYSV